MKKSYYNFLIHQEKDKHILYNSCTGALVELDEQHAQVFERCSADKIVEMNPKFADMQREKSIIFSEDDYEWLFVEW